jgi:hypothetical protein
MSMHGFNASFGFSQNANTYSRPDQDRNASFLENRWGSGLGGLARPVGKRGRGAWMDGVGRHDNLRRKLTPRYFMDGLGQDTYATTPGGTTTIDDSGNVISSTDAEGNITYSNGVIYSPDLNEYYYPDTGEWSSAATGVTASVTSSAASSTATTPAATGTSSNTSMLTDLDTLLSSVVSPTLTYLQQSNLATINAQLVAEGKTPLTPSQYLLNPSVSLASGLPASITSIAMWLAVAFVAYAVLTHDDSEGNTRH